MAARQHLRMHSPRLARCWPQQQPVQNGVELRTEGMGEGGVELHVCCGPGAAAGLLACPLLVCLPNHLCA
jgi:hypothetical protein